MHTRLQLDPSAEISVRKGLAGAVEIVVLDPQSDCSSVIELSPAQLDTIRQSQIRTA